MSISDTNAGPGPRSRKLQAMFDKALEKCVSSFNYSNVESLFPSLSDSEMLQKSHSEMIDFFKTNVNNDFHEISMKLALSEKLDNLDNLKSLDGVPGSVPSTDWKPEIVEAKLKAYFDHQKYPISLDECIHIKSELLKKNDALTKSINEKREILRTEGTSAREIMDQIQKCRSVLSEFDAKGLAHSASDMVDKIISNQFSPLQDLPAPIERI